MKFLLLLAAALLALPVFASSATADFFDWSSPDTVASPGTLNLPREGDGSVDILRLLYGFDGECRYFRLDLEAPLSPDWGYGTTYAIYFGPVGSLPTLESYSARIGSTYYGPTSGNDPTPLFDHSYTGSPLAFNYTPGETYLEWRIGRADFPDAFAFFGATLHDGFRDEETGEVRNYIDRTSVTATPLPPSLFLLASGLAALAGTRMKARPPR